MISQNDFKTLSIDGYELINFVILDEETLRKILSWRNHPDVRKWMYNHNIISKEEHFNFVKSLKNKKDMLYFLVKKEDKYIGVLDFYNINTFHRRAYFGVYSNPEEKIAGAGMILNKLAIIIAFDILNLHTLKLEVIADNIVAINLYKKVGFEQEGILKDYVFKDGVWKDVIVMGMINPKEKHDVNV